MMKKLKAISKKLENKNKLKNNINFVQRKPKPKRIKS